jgi:lysine 2,3-aminomutase
LNKAISLKTVDDLKNYGFISEEEVHIYRKVTEKFNVLIPPSMLNLMLQESNEGSIRQQFLPSLQELIETNSELSDPTGDNTHEVVKGVIHRYPDRCLLKVASVCPIYCRFCFRKELIGPRKDSLTRAELQMAYDYIRSQSGIWEVILTGGEPFILKPKKIADIVNSLASIEHVEIIRIHTRVPVVDPARISLDLIQALKSNKTVYVVLSANHPNEFTPEMEKACARLVNAGIPMLSQTVLLKGINNDVDILSRLMKLFVKNRIKPYYLHHPDLAKGTSHFRLTIEEGQQLVRDLQRKISGLCQPTYMLEIPGGHGKMTIGPCYAEKKGASWFIEDHHGNAHRYQE